MSVRPKRHTIPVDGAAMQEFVELAQTGRTSFPAQAKLLKLLDVGEGLRMTSGDILRVAIATLHALDHYSELKPTVEDVLRSFDTGRLTTEFREPMNVYLDRSAVSALVVAVCETCRPSVPLRASEPDPVTTEMAVSRPADNGHTEQPTGGDIGERHIVDDLASWPERHSSGAPQITLSVKIWWPGLEEWEPATLTAYVTKSRAFSGDHFTLLMEQDGDPEPARANSVWLLKREDLSESAPVYELRASIWEPGVEAQQYRFLVASTSRWCEELHDYLAAHWINQGQSPTGPPEFDSEPFGVTVE